MRKQPTGWICLRPKTRYAAKLTTCVQERILDRIGTRQRTVNRAGNIQPLQRQQVVTGIVQTLIRFGVDWFQKRFELTEDYFRNFSSLNAAKTCK